MTSLNECSATFSDARSSHFETHSHSHVTAKREGRNCILYRIDNIVSPVAFFSIPFRLYTPLFHFAYKIDGEAQLLAARFIFSTKMFNDHINVIWTRLDESLVVHTPFHSIPPSSECFETMRTTPFGEKLLEHCKSSFGQHLLVRKHIKLSESVLFVPF